MHFQCKALCNFSRAFYWTIQCTLSCSSRHPCTLQTLETKQKLCSTWRCRQSRWCSSASQICLKKSLTLNAFSSWTHCTSAQSPRQMQSLLNGWHLFSYFHSLTHAKNNYILAYNLFDVWQPPILKRIRGVVCNSKKGSGTIHKMCADWIYSRNLYFVTLLENGSGILEIWKFGSALPAETSPLFKIDT